MCRSESNFYFSWTLWHIVSPDWRQRYANIWLLSSASTPKQTLNSTTEQPGFNCICPESLIMIGTTEAFEELGMRNTGRCVQGQRGKGGFMRVCTYIYVTSTDDSEGLMTLVLETINGPCWVSAAPPHIQEYWLCVMNTLLETHLARCSRQSWTPDSEAHPSEQTYFIFVASDRFILFRSISFVKHWINDDI